MLRGAGGEDVLVIHKLEAHERPLWDYPDGTLVARERAAYLVSAAGGFDVVPPTVLRDGPLGHGSLQLWVGPLEGEPDPLVDVTAAADVPDGWLVVVEGETPSGAPVVVSTAPNRRCAPSPSSMPSSTTPTARAATSCVTAPSCAAATTASA